MTSEVRPGFAEELEQRVLPLLQRLHRRIRANVLEAFRTRDLAALAGVAGDEGGDTIYEVDRVSEEVLVEELGREAAGLGGIVLVAEGVAGGRLVLPAGL